MIKKGLIVRVTGGFYYVEADGRIYESKARGVFRKRNNSPYAGDIVDIDIPDDDSYSSIIKIYERKNFIIRPPLANIDNLIIVSSAVEPCVNLYLIDKMSAVAVSKNIKPVIVFTKSDLSPVDEYVSIYKNAGLSCFEFSSFDNRGLKEIEEVLKGRVSAFTGNTGVGKSTLINALFPGLCLQTGEISEKLGRGRHTTRTVELFKGHGGYIADTPGFSTVDIDRYELIKKDDLQYCFPEFESYIGECFFNSCSHTVEKGCSILKALSEGKIEKTRHNNYIKMYNEVKDLRDWQMKDR